MTRDQAKKRLQAAGYTVRFRERVPVEWAEQMLLIWPGRGAIGVLRAQPDGRIDAAAVRRLIKDVERRKA